MSVTLSGSVAISGTVNMDPAQPLVAVAGSTSIQTIIINNSISFSVFASVTGGYPPYRYVIISGTLPTGLSLNSSVGVVSGTATTIQALSNVIFAVQDAFGNQASTTVTVSFTVISGLIQITYALVGGGGGGGAAGGPGASWSGSAGGGGGGVTTGTNCFVIGGSYTITVGGAGAAGAPNLSGAAGSPGNSSSIAGPPAWPPNVTAGGGRGGGAICMPASVGPSTNASCIGAIGGNSGNFPASGFAGGQSGIAYRQATGTPSNLTSGGGGGGGGGAGGQGGNGVDGAVGTNVPSRGGSGGAGVPVTITGTSVIYGGGGAGGASLIRNFPNTNFPFPQLVSKVFGGTGGGGDAAFNSPVLTSGTAGTPGLGGGGAGTGVFASCAVSATAFAAQPGGSGTVIIKIPTPQYPGSAPGATVTTPPNAPGYTVLTYTTSSPTSPSTFTYTA